MQHGCWIAPVLATALLAGGCGTPQGRVSGTVTYQNKPVEAGTVTFYVIGAPRPVAAVITDGKYEAVDISPGEAMVTVSGPPPSEPVGKTQKGEGGRPRPTPVPATSSVPAKYADSSTSDLRFTVEPGENTIPINLK